MANKTEGLTFLQKLQKLQELMSEYAWEKDGIKTKYLDVYDEE